MGIRTDGHKLQIIRCSLNLLIDFDKIFSGTNKKFTCPENQELVSTFYMFPENATMDVGASEELVITFDDEVRCCVYISIILIRFILFRF